LRFESRKRPRITAGTSAFDGRAAWLCCISGKQPRLATHLPASLDVDAKGGTFNYEVALHVFCEYASVTDADWLAATRDTNNVASGYMRVLVAPNSSPARRVATVSVLAIPDAVDDDGHAVGKLANARTVHDV